MADSGMKEAGYIAAEVMARAGVRRLYTVPGESFLEILDVAEEHPGLSLVSTRHESGVFLLRWRRSSLLLTGPSWPAAATAGS